MRLKLGVALAILVFAATACRRPSAPAKPEPGDAGIDAATDAVARPPDDAAVARCGPSPGPALGHGRIARAAAALPDGTVLVAGVGLAGSGVQEWGAVLDPSSGTMVDVAMPASTGFRMVQMGETIVMLGSPHGAQPATEAWRFATKTRTWTKLPPMPSCVYAGRPAELDVTVEPIVLADGRLLVVGNQCAAILGADGTWSETAPLRHQRRGFTLTRLHNGDVLRIGGLATTGDGYLEASTIADRFDMKKQRWTALAPANYMRYSHSSVRLPDGRVLVVGGCEDSGTICESPDGPTPPAEMYDPARDRWTVLGAAAVTDRNEGTIIALPDKRVIVLGGYGKAHGKIPPTGVWDRGRWFELPGLTGSRSTSFAVLAGDHVLLSDWVLMDGPPELEWYGVAADCPATPVELGPARPPLTESMP